MLLLRLLFLLLLLLLLLLVQGQAGRHHHQPPLPPCLWGRLAVAVAGVGGAGVRGRMHCYPAPARRDRQFSGRKGEAGKQAGMQETA